MSEIMYQYPSKFLKLYNPPRDEPFISPYLKTQSIDNGDGVHISPKASCAFNGMTCVTDLFQLGVSISRNQPCLGSRKSVEEPYEWLTYEEVNAQVKQFGSGLRHMAGYEEGAANILGIYARNSIPWVVAMLGAQSYSYMYVPVYDTLGKESIRHILRQTDMKVILCQGCEQAKTILEFQLSISHVIIIEESPGATELISYYASNESIRICMFKDVLGMGKANPRPKCPLEPDNVLTICYTSGSSGPPKGVMLTSRQITNSISSVVGMEGYKFLNEKAVHSSHLPLPHVMEQLMTMTTLSTGGRAGMPTTGQASFRDDIRDLGPTVLAAVPRLLVKLRDIYLEKVQKKKFGVKLLAKQMKTSLRQQARGDYSKKTLLERVLFDDFRRRLGDNICVVVCGGAPLPGPVKQFIQVALKCPVLEGYGQTETSGVISFGLTGDMEVETAGSVTPNLEVKLFDVPEMELSVDNDGAGEICVRGVRCSAGYYRDEENTAKLYHPGGWLRTGDVGRWTKDGKLKVIDRCKSMFKLTQGEYVAPEKVENVLQLSDLVQFCLVYGKPTESYCVAIVVPNMEVLRAELDQVGVDLHMNGTVLGSSAAAPPISNSDLLQSTKVRQHLLKKINQHGRNHGLNGFELPKNIYLPEEEFTVTNGFLTPTQKISRRRVTDNFAEKLNAMYAEGELIKPSNEAAGRK